MGHASERFAISWKVEFWRQFQNQLGICASSGSACTSGSLDPSHVLMAMGCSVARARGSIRFSLGIYNTESEVDYVLKQLPPVIAKLRSHGPTAKGAHSHSKPELSSSGRRHEALQ